MYHGWRRSAAFCMGLGCSAPSQHQVEPWDGQPAEEIEGEVIDLSDVKRHLLIVHAYSIA
jgi:hypothetical protein